MFGKSIILATSVAFVSAQQLPTLSSTCTSALTGLVANSEVNSCLNPGALLQLVGATNTSIISPINNWLTGLCSAPACSNATLTAVVQNITTGCSAEINTFTGSSGTDAASLITPYVLMGYPTVRSLVCLKDGDDLCVTKTLTSLEGTFGTLSINGIASLASSDAAANLTIPKNVTCSNCAKGAFNIIQAAYPDTFINKDDASSTCGATFVDGSTPSGVTLSASTASTTATGKTGNSAIGSMGSVTGIAAFTVAAVVAISSGIAVLV